MKKNYLRHETLKIEWRKAALESLRKALGGGAKQYAAAALEELGWSETDTQLELGLIYSNIDNTLKNLDKWMADTEIDAPFVCIPSKNRIHYDPLGVVLVIGTWNYPVFTLFEPVVSAIAAGNAVVMKPSENAPKCSAAMRKMIELMDQDYFRCVEGGPDVGKKLT